MGDYSKKAAQADFAYRIGEIARTYHEVAKTSNKEVYEATLYVCLLHPLLTVCDEMLGRMKREKPARLDVPLPQQGTYWGLNASMVQTTFMNEPLYVRTVVEHMRNAVSHPSRWNVLSQNCDIKHPSTGFYRSRAEDEQIAAFAFIDSPDVREGSIWTKDKDRADNLFARNKRHFPVGAEVKQYENGYIVVYRGQPYPRYFKIDMPIMNLYEFVQEMSSFLYQQFGKDGSDAPKHRANILESGGRR